MLWWSEVRPRAAAGPGCGTVAGAGAALVEVGRARSACGREDGASGDAERSRPGDPAPLAGVAGPFKLLAEAAVVRGGGGGRRGPAAKLPEAETAAREAPSRWMWRRRDCSARLAAPGRDESPTADGFFGESAQVASDRVFPLMYGAAEAATARDAKAETLLLCTALAYTDCARSTLPPVSARLHRGLPPPSRWKSAGADVRPVLGFF